MSTMLTEAYEKLAAVEQRSSASMSSYERRARNVLDREERRLSYSFMGVSWPYTARELEDLQRASARSWRNMRTLLDGIHPDLAPQCDLSTYVYEESVHT